MSRFRVYKSALFCHQVFRLGRQVSQNVQEFSSLETSYMHHNSPCLSQASIKRLSSGSIDISGVALFCYRLWHQLKQGVHGNLANRLCLLLRLDAQT